MIEGAWWSMKKDINLYWYKHSRIQWGRQCVARTIALCGAHVLLAPRYAMKPNTHFSEGKKEHRIFC